MGHMHHIRVFILLSKHRNVYWHGCAFAYICSGGVLTYILPTTYDFTEKDLPVHPCLRLVQVLYCMPLMQFMTWESLL